MPLAPEPATSLLAAAALVLLVGTLPVLAGARIRIPGWLAWLPAVVGSVLALAASLQVIGTARPAAFSLAANLAGVKPAFALTPLAAWFALGVAGPGLAAALAAALRPGRAGAAAGAAAAFHLLLLGQLLFLAAADVVSLLLGWQLVALGGFAAIARGATGATQHPGRPAGDAAGEGGPAASPALRFLIACELCAALSTAGLMFAASPAGPSGLQFPALAAASGALAPVGRSFAFLLLLAGFSLAAGMVPFHASLPRAQAVAGTPAAVLLSAGLPRIGAAALARVVFEWLPGGPPWWGALLLIVAALTMLHTLLLALAELDLRLQVATIGIAGGGPGLFALGIAATAGALDAPGIAGFALVAVVFASLVHATTQTALVLATGMLVECSSVTSLDRMGGLLRRLPWSGAALLMGAMAAAALPPFGGFVSLWLVMQVLLVGLHLPLGALKLAVLAATAAAALAASLATIAALRTIGCVLLGPRASEAGAEPPLLSRLPAIAAGVTCIALGLFAGPLLHEMAPATAAVAGYGGVVPALSVPAPGPLDGWPESAVGRAELALLRMPALVAALVVASMAGFALLRAGHRSAESIAALPPLAARRLAETADSTRAAAAGGTDTTGLDEVRLSAAGFAQPFVAAFPELYGSVEEATILEGSAAHFPTRVSFHHGIRPFFAARSVRLCQQLEQAARHVARSLAEATPRGRLVWLLATVISLLVVLGR